MWTAASTGPDLRRRRRAGATWAGIVVLATAAAGCGDPGADEPTPAEYAEEMTAICVDTAATLDALPAPPEEISFVDFATEAAVALENEAELARVVDPPDDLADDHRAFIANTDEQADAWRSLAATAPDDTDGLNALSERIAALTLGRDDLSVEMGLDGCRRADV